MKHLFSLLVLVGGTLLSPYFLFSSVSAQEAPDSTAPSVPTNLTVTPASTTELDLTWVPATDNVAVTGYKVYRRSVSTGPDSLVATLGAVTAYEDTGFSPNTKYWYSLSAIDAAGNESVKTELRSGRTLVEMSTADILSPSTPGGLTATAVSATQINLSWNLATDNVAVTGYRVYKRSTSGGADTLLGTLSERTYSDTDLTPLTKFWYSLSAIDAAGNESSKTELRSARTLAGTGGSDILAPSVPTNLTVTPASTTELDLTWVPATDNVAVTGYKVYRRSVSTGPDSLVATLGAVTAYEDTGFSPNTKYWYSLSAIDAAGNESAKTELRSGRTLVGPGEADLPAGELGPDITVGIFFYTTSDLRTSSLRIKADGTFAVVKKSGEKVIDIPAGKDIRVSYLGNKIFRVYDPDTDTTIDEASNEIRFEAADTSTIFDVSRPNSAFDRYRGDLKLRFYDSSIADGDRIWVINTLPLEHYTWGMGEITGTGADEYDKVMTMLFRTYGYWKIKWSTKYAEQGFKVNATSGDQVYYGYDWEITHSDIRKAAEATHGELVMHGGKIALTAYSAWTDGATRRFEDGLWGGACSAETGKISSIYPWLSAVPDPKGKHPTQSTCSLAASGNHMVGLSANGALRLAGDSGWKAKAILSYYFSGVYFFKGY